MDSRVRSPSGGLLEIMRENARKLLDIRKMCNKVAVIRNMGQQPAGVQCHQLHLTIDIPASSPAKQAARPG